MDAFIECLFQCFGELCCEICAEGATHQEGKAAALLICMGLVALAAPVCLIVGIVFLVKRAHYTAGVVLTVTGAVLTFLFAVWVLCRSIVGARRRKHVKELVRNAPKENNLYRSGLTFEKDAKSNTVVLPDENVGLSDAAESHSNSKKSDKTM